MEYKLPERFIKFPMGWQREYDFKKEAEDLLEVIKYATKEKDIQDYIKQNRKWFIPASIFKNYDFGHHEAYLVPEQALGNKYRVDYMLLGRNSLGYQIVFVEFENINVDYCLKKSPRQSDAVRKGIDQIKDWRRWIDDNRKNFLDDCGLRDISGNIPVWGFWYCLVVGRRDRMDSIANELRGQEQYITPQLKIISYDRLVENVELLHNGF